MKNSNKNTSNYLKIAKGLMLLSTYSILFLIVYYLIASYNIGEIVLRLSLSSFCGLTNMANSRFNCSMTPFMLSNDDETVCSSYLYSFFFLSVFLTFASDAHVLII